MRGKAIPGRAVSLNSVLKRFGIWILKPFSIIVQRSPTEARQHDQERQNYDIQEFNDNSQHFKIISKDYIDNSK